MFFLGQTTSPVNAATFHSDILGLLTGTITSADQLSAFIKETVKLVSTEAPGWEMHDNNAGVIANGIVPKVIRAPLSDDPTRYKYAKFEGENSGGYLRFVAYEGWNAATHIGTNPAGSDGSQLNWRRFNIPTNAWVMLSVSKNHLLFSLIGNPIATNGIHHQLIAEYTRDDPWNTLESGYPAFFHSGNSSGNYGGYDNCGMSMPRILNVGAAPPVEVKAPQVAFGDNTNGRLFRILPTLFTHHSNATGSNGNLSVGLEGVGTFFPGHVNLTADRNKQPSIALSPIALRPADGFTYGLQMGGSITQKVPFIYATRGYFATSDEIEVGGDRYFILTFSTSSCIAIKEA